MNSPFAQDNRALPFQQLFEPRSTTRPVGFDSAPSHSGGPLRPFTALDIAPPPQLGSAPSLAPAVSPFLETTQRPLADAEEEAALPVAPLEPAASTLRPRFFLTSTASVEGRPIQALLDILSVEVVVPKDLLFRNPAPYGELHRLKAAEDELQRVKAKAMEELAEKAKHAGADGVVGVQLSFVNLDTVCCLCSVVGTAVKLQPAPREGSGRGFP